MESSSSYQVDRAEVSPTLVRLFWRKGRHHSFVLLLFYPFLLLALSLSVSFFFFLFREGPYRRIQFDEFPYQEVQVYTWLDTTLRELFELLKDQEVKLRRSQHLSFAVVYPNKDGRYVVKKMGEIYTCQEGEDDNKTLKELGMEVGDFVDVLIPFSNRK